MVKECNPCECQETNKVVSGDILYALGYFSCISFVVIGTLITSFFRMHTCILVIGGFNFFLLSLLSFAFQVVCKKVFAP